MGQPAPSCFFNLEATAIIASKITPPFEGAGLRALYLAKRVRCPLVGRDDPQILMDPPEFMHAPYPMANVSKTCGGVALLTLSGFLMD